MAQPPSFAIALPVCQKDQPAALRNLAWCLQLNPVRQPFTCIVFYESNCPGAGSVVEAARRCFTDVREAPYAPYRGSLAWPGPPNYAFKTAASLMSKNPLRQPWIWWEQDAVPLTQDWLKTIASAYFESRKPFMGAHGQLSRPGQPQHLNGVAVYPFNALTLAPGLSGNPNVAFDVSGGARVMAQAAISPLFHHVYSFDSGGAAPPTFPDDASVARIRPDAVLFHRCKDATLIEHLSVRAVTNHPGTPQLKDSLLQTLMRWKYGTGKWIVGKVTRGPRKVTSGPKLVHCLERHKQASSDAERRVLQAQESWVALYKTGGVVPAHVWSCDRNSEQVGDSRRLPYLKDVLVAGLNAGQRTDHVIITNDDTILHPRVHEYLIEELNKKPAISSFRINFEKGAIPSLSLSPASLLEKSHKLVPKGDDDIGRDLFAFRKDWLRDYWHEIPDFFLGELEWDLVIAYMIRRDSGIQTTKFNMGNIMPECEMPKGWVLHERHNRQWTSVQFESAPAKRWNRNLATEFYCDNDMHFLVTNKL